MSNGGASVFVVEDEAIIAMEFEDRIRALGYTVAGHAARGDDALVRIRQTVPAIVLLDIHLSGEMSGIDVAKELRGAQAPVVVFVTAYSDDSLITEACESQAYSFLVKPFDDRTLRACIEMALSKRVLEADVERAHSRLRKQAEELETANSLLSAALEATADGLMIIGRDGRVAASNRKFRQLWKIPDDRGSDASGESVIRILGDQVADADGFVNRVREVQSRPEHEAFDIVGLSDGRVFEQFVAPQLLRQLVVGQVFSYRDVSELKATHREMKWSNERFRILFESSPDSIVITDKNGIITMINRQAESVLGWSQDELVGQPVETLVPEGHRGAHPSYRNEFAKEGSFRIMGERGASLHALRKDGQFVPVEITLAPISSGGDEEDAVVAVIRDISARVSSDRMLMRTQRLESLGTLAGGVAHDLNNTLSPILMAAEMLRSQPDGAEDYLSLIERSVKRGTAMIRQLLDFAKGSDGRRVVLAADQLLRDVESIVRSTFPKSIRLTVSSEPDGAPIKGDPTQLHQVLLNLCVNARDAMPDGGSLELTSGNVTLDGAAAASIPGAVPGDYVVLRVQDTGTGIPSDIIDQIFDPFFSTKDHDKGTGLGLAGAMGIVKGHSGFLRVDSTEGLGTLFEVYLPQSEGEASEPGAVSGVEFHGDGELVLVVDDEQAVRELLCMMLEALSLEPITASNGTEALIQCSEHRDDIRLILTDINMPVMDGFVFAESVRSMLPGVPIVVVTGLEAHETVDRLKEVGVDHILSKPFTVDRLSEVLKVAFSA